MKNKGICTLFILLAASLWGSMGIFVRYFEKIGLRSMDVVLLRVVVAAVVLPLVVGVMHPQGFKVKIKDLWCFMGTGILSIAMFSFCYFKTITLTSLSVAAVLLYLAPVLVLLMSALFFKEKITLKKAIACMVAFLGCVLVSDLKGGAVPPLALLTGFLSAFGYAMYSIFSRLAMNRGYHSLTITLYTFWLSIFGVLPFAKPLEAVEKVAEAGWQGILMVVLMAIITSVLPYIFYTLGLSGLEAGKASIMASLEPVVATIIGIFAFGEIPSLMGFGGILLVLMGVVMLNVGPKKV